MPKEVKNSEENLVKKTCRELGITQKELAERIGTHDTTVAKWISNNNMPKSAKKTLELVLENNFLHNRINKIVSAFQIIDEIKQEKFYFKA
jgi:DNA-binding transcriptional regulator YiaG